MQSYYENCDFVFVFFTFTSGIANYGVTIPPVLLRHAPMRIFHANILQKTLNSLRSTQPRLDREQTCNTKRETVTAHTKR